MANKYKYPKNRLLTIFRGMHSRCKDENCERYGARGITVDPVWSEFEPFEAWAIASGYSPFLTLDRIKGELGYSPDNCRWATFVTQSRNKGKRAGGKSQFMGVAWFPRNSKWGANVFHDKKNHHLGLFATEEEAAQARDAYIITNKLLGFNLNFP